MTSTSRGARATWRSLRAPLAVAGLLVAVTIATALAQSQGRRGFLDPDAVDDAGSRAVANCCASGRRRAPGRTTDDGRDRGPGRQHAAGRDPRPAHAPASWNGWPPLPADVLVVAPDDAALAELAPDIRLSRTVGVLTGSTVRPPDCDLPAAERAGTAVVTSVASTGAADAASSSTVLPDSGNEPGLVRLEQAGRTVTVLGDPTALTNAALPEQGNAALALGLAWRARRR